MELRGAAETHGNGDPGAGDNHMSQSGPVVRVEDGMVHIVLTETRASGLPGLFGGRVVTTNP